MWFFCFPQFEEGAYAYSKKGRGSRGERALSLGAGEHPPLALELCDRCP